MNKIFSFVILLAGGILLFTSPDELLGSMLSASQKAVSLCVSLLAIYAVWLGLLELVARTELDKKLAKLVSPLSRRLFGKQNSYTEEQIAINLSSNMLGMGNASTPSGINAMKGLDKGTGKITKAMAMLMIINTTAIQLVPTTILGLRIANGSRNPTSVLIPTLIATTASTIAGILLVIIVDKLIKKYKGRKSL
jgi:spore maturation protein A